MSKRVLSGRPFAVFDIDGTLFRSSLIIKFVGSAIDVGVFPPEAAKMYAKSYRDWKERSSIDAYERYIDDVVKTFLTHIIGKTEKDIARAVKRAMSWHRQTYVYTRELIKQLRPTHAIIAISGSNTEILSHFAPSHGFDIFHGTELIKKNGRFTGEEAHIGHHNKDKTLKNIVKEHGLSFKNSIAVGDTDNDIAMLKLAEAPIAFNPSRKLFEHAKDQGWKVVVERKNMIYELEKRGGKYRLA